MTLLRRPETESRPATRRSRDGSAALLLASILLMSNCSTPEQERAKQKEAPPNPDALVLQTQPSPTPAPQSSLSPPTLPEVQEAVKRIFKESVAIDSEHRSKFTVGDFNGDFSQDLAVVIKPVPDKLPELNEEAPPWILRDPFVVRRPGMLPLRVTGDESLLAVIHGYGAEGWRDPQATQTFLLKNAVGPGVESYSKTAVVNQNRGRKMPQLRGDLIAEVLKGTAGYLYYDDAGYSWFDPKNFKEEPVKRLVHSGMAARK